MASLPVDMVCFCHLRYRFVFQRPNHLMSRFARERRVFYVEEPLPAEGASTVLIEELYQNLYILTPRLANLDVRQELIDEEVSSLLADALAGLGVSTPIAWFYTPMMLPWARHIAPSVVVYDCMDELRGFLGASPLLLQREMDLFEAAHLVFTGGHSLYEAKKSHHPSVHAFPSSVDAEHFIRARSPLAEPVDQAPIPGPRVGYFGVIDERMDLELIERIADARPGCQFVMVGPVVKISEGSLPRRTNIHYLGPKAYADLPSYISGWDVAMMPFALNAATRYISPTKTLEYLAAGKPIVSTAIRDVVTPYGECGAAAIASISDFADRIDTALIQSKDEHLSLADAILARTSWDETWSRMSRLIQTLPPRGASPSPRPSTERTNACSTT